MPCCIFYESRSLANNMSSVDQGTSRLHCTSTAVDYSSSLCRALEPEDIVCTIHSFHVFTLHTQLFSMEVSAEGASVRRAAGQAASCPLLQASGRVTASFRESGPDYIIRHNHFFLQDNGVQHRWKVLRYFQPFQPFLNSGKHYS